MWCGVPSKTKIYQALQIGEAATFRKMGEASQPPQTSLVKTKNKGGMLVGCSPNLRGEFERISFSFFDQIFCFKFNYFIEVYYKMGFYFFFFFFPDKNSHYSLASISCAKYCPNRFFRLRRQWQRRLGSTTEWQSLLSTKRSFGWDSVFCIYDYLDSCFNESKIQYERLFSFICNVLIWHIIIGYGIYSHKRLNYFT